VDIKHIRLDLRVDLPKKTVGACATLQVRSVRAARHLTLDAVDFEVKRVTVAAADKEPERAAYSHDGKKLTIDLDPAWPAGRSGTVRVDYRVRSPKEGLHFFGPTAGEPNFPYNLWSQGEPNKNRYWFPCHDRPNQLQPTEMVISVPRGYEALSNGSLVERREGADQTVIFHWRQKKPHPAYLVSLVVGRYDVVREEWKGRPLLYYVPRGHKVEAVPTFGRTRDMLTFFSKRFGIEYPWAKYAQVVVEQFTFGGMENTSATTLPLSVLCDKRARLDNSPDETLAHELAHQWWGDMVAVRDWAHTWLKEGLATYAEALWAEHDRGADDFAYKLVQDQETAILAGARQAVVDRRYRDPDETFDYRAYQKGGWVFHMLRRRLGEELFWKGLCRYGTDFRGQAADTTDLRKTLEKVSGRSLERFFYDWTERPGSPVLDVATVYRADKKQARVVVKQTQAGEAFHLPFKITFACPAAARPVVFERALTAKEHTFLIPLPGPPARLEVDPDQAVLATIRETKDRELWLGQLRDGGVAARLRAVKHFTPSRRPADKEALIAAFAADKFWGVRVEIARVLGRWGENDSRDALIAGLKHADPRVRRVCAEGLARFYHDRAVRTALKALLDKGDPSYFVEAAALESYGRIQPPDAAEVLTPWLAKSSHQDVLRVGALSGLGHAADLSVLDTLAAWTKRGKPRPCREAALTALAELVQGTRPSAAQLDKVVAAATACLNGESAPVKRSALWGLSALGPTASPARPALRALKFHDHRPDIRQLAEDTLKQVERTTPAPEEVKRLRREVERLRKANQALQEKLEKYEKAAKKAG
jgi:aminopeptidase N